VAGSHLGSRDWGGLVRRDDGRYAVGPRLWDIGLLASLQTGLRQVASPFLHDVYAATLATVHLAVRDGHEVLYLERLAGRSSVPIVSTVGSRLPLHCTGVGKVCWRTPRTPCSGRCRLSRSGG